MIHGRVTRWLHFGLAAACLLAMVVGLAVEEPEKARSGFQRLTFGAHQYLGYAVAALATLLWLWSVHTGRLGALVPWFAAARRAELANSARTSVASLLRLELPRPEGDAVAAAVQGIGLLLATALAASGIAIAATAGRLSHLLSEFHEALAPAMWTYLGLHTVMAILHHLAGHGSLDRISPRPRDSRA